MRTRAARTLLGPLALALALAASACAAPDPTGSASGSTALSAVASGATTVGSTAVASVLASAAPAATTDSARLLSSPQVSRAIVGTQADIPSAPGTAGSAQVPMPATAPAVTSGPGAVAAPLPSCSPSTLHTQESGRLTFTTGPQAGAPWFVGNHPANGEGYEAAVAAAVATELGYSSGDVRWTRTDPGAVVAGRAGGFDVAVGEFAVPDSASTPVDYSTGYFSISDSVVALAGSAAASATGLAGLKTLRTGTVTAANGAGSAGAESALAARPKVYPTVAAGLAALHAGTVDAVVLPTPAAVAAGPSVTVIGQLTNPAEQPQQFGMVLAKRSPLTACVSAAIDQLRVTGALGTLVRTWVPAADKPLT